MNAKVTKSLLIRLGVIYGAINTIINYFGYFFVTSEKIPIRYDTSYRFWTEFLDNHGVIMATLTTVAFGLPTILCLVYCFGAKEKNLERRVINIPIAFALSGVVGWSFSYFNELIILIYICWSEDINVHMRGVSSFLNSLQCSIFIFTLSFVLLDAIQRAFVLPKYFPEGKVTRKKGVYKMSTKVLLTVFYLSVGIFPMFYELSILRNFSFKYDFKIEGHVYLMLLGFLLVDLVIVLAFSNYITKPLQMMRGATKAIKDGEGAIHLDIVTCDDFGELADNFNDMSQSLEEKSLRIHSIQDSIIRGMAVMIEGRDNSTGSHINRTSDCVKIFVQKLKETGKPEFTASFCSAMIKAAPMHDLGKIVVDDAILRKPGKYTPEEFEIMKSHAHQGARIVAKVLSETDDLEFKNIAVNVAHYHHEKWNGGGYPDGLKGKEIPLEARIMALADVFDALVSKRYYKARMGYDEAFDIIKSSIGTHFDPALGKVFIECRPALEELYNGYDTE